MDVVEFQAKKQTVAAVGKASVRKKNKEKVSAEATVDNGGLATKKQTMAAARKACVQKKNKEKTDAEATVDNGGLPSTKKRKKIAPDDEAKSSSPLPKHDTIKQKKEKEKEEKEKKLSQYFPLYRAALQGDWETANDQFFKNDDDNKSKTAKITKISETALHVAAGQHHATEFVKKLVESMPEVESVVSFDRYRRTPLASAAIAGNTEAAKILVEKNPKLLELHNYGIYTPIHYAARYGHEETVRYLLSAMEMEEAKLPKKEDKEQSPLTGKSGAVLLILLITANFYAIALYLVKRDPKLLLERGDTAVGDRDDAGETAFQALAKRPLAFESGSRFGYLQRFIYYVIHVDINNASFVPTKDGDICKKNSEDKDGSAKKLEGDVENPTKSSSENSSPKSTHDRVLHQWISTTFGTLSRKVRSMFWHAMKRLVPCINHIHDAKLMHMQALELVGFLCEQELSNKDAWKLLEEPLRTAARLGIHEFVVQILKTYPYLIWSMDKEKKHTIFHIAVLNRHEKVFSLIYQIGSYKHPIAELNEKGNNNILHLAGMLGPSTQVSGAALQMQRELLWFKEVEKCVQSSYKEEINKENKTPRMVFTEAHKDLVEKGEKWMKETATSCSVVAALIVTVMFAATFTVPGGNKSDQGTPIFLNELSFMFFALSDAVGLFFSSASVLMLLGILTSRYSEEDFLVSLPRKLMIGLITLFISIASMVVAFSAAFYIVLVEKFNKWIILIPVTLLGCLPVLYLFAQLQIPLLLDIFLSTYGPSIFRPKSKGHNAQLKGSKKSQLDHIWA